MRAAARQSASPAGLIGGPLFPWIMIGVLLFAGCQLLYIALRNGRMVSLSVAEFLAHPPDAEWLELCDAELDLAAASYQTGKSGRTIMEVFIPVRPAGSSRSEKAGISLATRDANMISLMDSLSLKKPGGTALAKLPENPRRTIHGLVQTGTQRGERQWQYLAALDDHLTPQFTVIREGEAPKLWYSIALIAGGLTWLAWKIFRLRRTWKSWRASRAATTLLALGLLTILLPACRSAATGLPMAAVPGNPRVPHVLNRLRPFAPAGSFTGSMIVPSAVPNASINSRGTLTLTTGLLEFAETDDLLAFAIAHELAHAELGHPRRQLRNGWLQLLATGAVVWAAREAGGDAALRGAGFFLTSSLLGTLPAMRRMEKEADLRARDIMRRAGFDPAAAAGFWERYASARPQSPRPRWLSEHPPDAERVRYLTAPPVTAAAPRN